MLYRIQVTVRYTATEGLKFTGKEMQTSREVPTFYLDSGTQGFPDAKAAAEFALTMVTLINPGASADVTAFCEETNGYATAGHCGWCRSPRLATSIPNLCPTHRSEYLALYRAPQEV